MSQRGSYSEDFKLKVLEYFLKHGGNNKFGLKAQTANHFSIDHKTVSRIALNSELVKKVQGIIRKSNKSASSKASSSDSDFKANKRSDSSKISSSSANQKMKLPNVVTQEGSVVDLPEDPDYSILKQGIDSSSSGAGSVAHLLVKGTDEVKQLIINECKLIYECKICRNLFRSVVNFLAHKRMYCEEKFTSSLQSFDDKDPETCTVLPTEPCDAACSFPPRKKRNIDSIFSNLNSPNDSLPLKLPSKSPLHRLRPSKVDKKGRTREPTVLLNKIEGVSSAVFQTPLLPLRAPSQSNITNLLEEIAEKKKKSVEFDLPSIKNEAPDTNADVKTNYICKHCNSNFSSLRLLRVHTKGKFCIERKVYTCPICSLIFLTLWGCCKHLHKLHKKKKHQRARLRDVINNRACKRILSSQELQNLKLRKGTNISSSTVGPEKAVTKPKNMIANGLAHGSKILTMKKIYANTKLTSSSKAFNSCQKCNQRFLTPVAVKSHFCNQQRPKKIEIQIRKEYKKEPLSSQVSNNNSVAVAGSSQLQERLEKVCDIENQICKFCDRKYQTVNILKRHVAVHIGWTRFSCSLCSFRSYDKYICSQHCSNSHDNENSNDLVLERECFRRPSIELYNPATREPKLEPDVVLEIKREPQEINEFEDVEMTPFA